MSAWLETVRPPIRSQAAAVAWTNLKRARHRREVRFGFICYLVPKLAFSRCLSSGSSAAEQDFIFRASTSPHYWHSGSTSCACGGVCGFSFSRGNVKAPSSLNPCVLAPLHCNSLIYSQRAKDSVLVVVLVLVLEFPPSRTRTTTRRIWLRPCRAAPLR